MKQLFLFFLMTFLIVSCFLKKNGKVAIIKGEVLSGKAKQVKFEWIVDNPITGKGETYTAEIDSNSHFSIEIPIERIAAGIISVEGFFHEIYLIPGDDFFISIDADTIKYKGKGASKNNYLYQSEINGLWDGAFFQEINKGVLPPKDFLDVMILFKQKRLEFFESYQDSIKLQKEFIDFYRIKTQVIFEQLIQEYPLRYAYINKIHQDSIDLPGEFKAFSYFSNYVDGSKAICPDYIHNLRNQLFSKAREIIMSDISVKWNDAIYIAIFDSLSGTTREYVLTKWICTEFSEGRYNTLATEKFKKIEKGELADTTFNHALNKFNEKRSLIGKPLHPEFSETLLKDTSEIQLTFGEMMKKYKGKVVYLDIWSLGCAPCIAAMPYSKKLKEKLSGLPIEFIYISQDAPNKDLWKNISEKTFTRENQYRMVNYQWGTSRMLKFMEINWVPCYMIFDKEGKLIDFNADSPFGTDEGAVTILEMTLKELASK
jgi:thiol-disulfide isomerase/thioredoxin